MKAQCERCKEIVPLEFTPRADPSSGSGGIDVRCPACGAAYFVEAVPGPPQPQVVPRLAAGDMRCAKCGERQPEAEACRRCGLVQSKWIAGPDPDLPGSPEAQELWQACRDAWSDPAAHEAFLLYCQRIGDFAFAAARYRAAQDERGQDPVAAARLKQVRSMAEFALLSRPKSSASPAEESLPYRGSVLVLGVILALLVGGVVYMLLVHKK